MKPTIVHRSTTNVFMCLLLTLNAESPRGAMKPRKHMIWLTYIWGDDWVYDGTFVTSADDPTLNVKSWHPNLRHAACAPCIHHSLPWQHVKEQTVNVGFVRSRLRTDFAFSRPFANNGNINLFKHLFADNDNVHLSFREFTDGNHTQSHIQEVLGIMAACQRRIKNTPPILHLPNQRTQI